MRNERRIALFLFSLFLVCAISAAADTGYDDSYAAFKGHMEGWMPIAITAVMLCVFFNVLLYMVGTVFQSEHLKKYAESEFMQVTASSLMIFFVVALLGMLMTPWGGDQPFMEHVLGAGSTISCTAASNGVYSIFNNGAFGGGPLGAFKCKLQEKITALDRAYSNIVSQNMGVERLTSMCLSIFGVPVYCGDWTLSTHNRMEVAHFTAAKIVGLLMPLHAQYVLAQYLQNNMLSVFLPLGLILRITPLTRGIGGLFIAIAIAFFFVWPTFFVLTDPTFVRADARVDDMQKGVCFTGFSGAATVLSNPLVNSGGSGADLAVLSGGSLIYELSIAVLFYPFVALVIALAFIRAVTPLLGGDTGELMRMVTRLG